MHTPQQLDRPHQLRRHTCSCWRALGGAQQYRRCRHNSWQGARARGDSLTPSPVHHEDQVIKQAHDLWRRLQEADQRRAVQR